MKALLTLPADPRGVHTPSSSASRPRIVVGIGEFAVSNDHESLILTHALGSCVAVCLWDPVARVAGLMHVLLPDSRVNPSRAEAQPAAFADTGVPLLFETAAIYGVQPCRSEVSLVGGADVTPGLPGAIAIGTRNVVALQRLLAARGVPAPREAVGGREARTVVMSVRDGRVRVASGGQVPPREW